MQGALAEPVIEPGGAKRSPNVSAKRIFINAASGAGLRVVMLAIGFVLTPYILHHLGLQSFGLWSILGALAGYLQLLDFGLGGAFVRFMTQFLESGRKLEARQTLTFGVAFYGALAIVLTLVAYTTSPYIVHILHMPARDYGLATAVFRVLFAILIANLVLGLSVMMLVAMHRQDLSYRNMFYGYLVYVVATIVLLHSGRGLWGVITAQAIQVVATAAINYVTARRMFGPLFANPLTLDRSIVKELFSFGGWTQLNNVLSVVNVDVGRFISASVISVSSVTYYELGSKVSLVSKILPSYFVGAALPAAAAADVHRDDEILRRMYAAGSIYSMFATLTVAGFLVGASSALLKVWLGRVNYSSVSLISAVILCLSIGYGVNSLVGIGSIILRARGLPKYETYYTAVGTVSNVVATLLLAPHFGVVGVAMGSSIGWVAASAFFLVIFHKISNVPWWRSVGVRALRLGAVTVVCTASLWAALHVPAIARLFTGNQIEGMFVLCAAAVLFAALLLGSTLLVRVWLPEDIARGRRLLAFRLPRRGNAAA